MHCEALHTGPDFKRKWGCTELWERAQNGLLKARACWNYQQACLFDKTKAKQYRQ